MSTNPFDPLDPFRDDSTESTNSEDFPNSDDPWHSPVGSDTDADALQDSDAETMNEPRDLQFAGPFSKREEYPKVYRILETIADDFDGPQDFETAAINGDPRIDPGRHDITNDGTVDLFDAIEFRKANGAGGFDPSKWARSSTSSESSGGSDPSSDGETFPNSSQPWHSPVGSDTDPDALEDGPDITTPDESEQSDPNKSNSAQGWASGSGSIMGIPPVAVVGGLALIAWGVTR